MPPCPQGCRCGRHSLPGRPRTDSPGYSGRHKRVTRDRGSASDHNCVRCIERGITKKASTWARIHDTAGTDSWADYVALCRKCHFEYDCVHEIRLAKGWTNGSKPRTVSPEKVRLIREAADAGGSAREIAEITLIRLELIERIIARTAYKEA